VATANGSAGEYRELAELAAEIARTAGEAIVVRDIEIVVRKKGRANFATKADHAAERAILARLKEATPNIPVLAEESAADGPRTESRLWIVDPIDGTLNFSRALPFYCVAIAYVEQGRTRASAVYAPRTGELFSASEGHGASLNGMRLSVAESRPLEDCFAVTSLAYRAASKRRSRFVALNRVCARLRVIGSAALEMSYLAAGRFDLFVHESLGPWDIAAPWLLAREAGAAVIDLETGRPAGSLARKVCVGHPDVVQEALKKIPELLEVHSARR